MLPTKPPSFEHWRANIPDAIRNDPLWKNIASQKALFLYDLSWYDCDSLLKDVRGIKVTAQLIAACGSISANIEEGFGKGLGADYARFLSIAPGSARETRGWYWRARHKIPAPVVEHRMTLATEIIALLATIIPLQRSLKRTR